MLSGGIDQSFAQLLLSRGYQIRLSPKGTLPFDTESSLPQTRTMLARLRRDPAIEAAGAVLGASLYGKAGDTLITLFGYGIQPEAQALYQVTGGRDLAPNDTLGVLVSDPAARALSTRIGDTISLLGRLDPQIAVAGVGRSLVVRGRVRFVYDYRGQPSVATVLRTMQRLAREDTEDRASLVVVKVRDDRAVEKVATRLRRHFPQLEVNSVTDLVAHFRERLVYFRQLSYILGSMSLIVTVLLIGTLLTITVNERLGEIATLRAIGVSRASIVRQVLAEGTVLVLLGSTLGVLLGLVTARYLDAILTSFPGLPASFSFFVPRANTLSRAGVILVFTGSIAGLYPAWLAARAPIAATLRAEAT
jgi:putative ABC transport system permease protein